MKDQEYWWFARSVRSRMLQHGVWAISDREDTVRLYPALNMDPQTLADGLDVMRDAIEHVSAHGQREGR
ncbi:MAG: hypothetical protein V2J89_09235 [Halieaceae bacterium]|nr:hypothetical protein [Halieaceae bacterium]